MIVTKTGFPITYSITNPGVHDVKVLETLSEEANLPNILGDKGYISHKIHEKLALKGTNKSTDSSLTGLTSMLSRASSPTIPKRRFCKYKRSISIHPPASIASVAKSQIV
ncbi:hypothetical protein EfmAA242_18450 [Enterococcus faecium]|nr:hypothetical protein EfmAA242_18450 [Enterococcus faecium]